MPPELIQILATPFFIFLGVLVKVVYDIVAAKFSNKVNVSQVKISEKDANTRQFEAIVEGFNHALAAARTEAERANNRIDVIERERIVEKGEIIAHLNALEMLVPTPPGPPPRPTWLLY